MISAVVDHMTQNPEMKSNLYQEIYVVFATQNEKIKPEHSSEFVYLNSCREEALRFPLN